MPGTWSRGLSRDLIVQHITASKSEHVALLGTFRQIWINRHSRWFAASLRAQSGKFVKGTRVSRMCSVIRSLGCHNRMNRKLSDAFVHAWQLFVELSCV